MLSHQNQTGIFYLSIFNYAIEKFVNFNEKMKKNNTEIFSIKPIFIKCI